MAVKSVLVCADDPMPADGSPVTACTNVVLVQQEMGFSDLIPDWTSAEWGQLEGALIALIVGVWLARLVVDAGT